MNVNNLTTANHFDKKLIGYENKHAQCKDNINYNICCP
jgi:hypothetical protein